MLLAVALSAKDIANNLFTHIINPLIGGMLFIAILVFIIISIKLLTSVDSPGDRKDLFVKLFWSIVGIFIIVSVWTIIHFVSRLAESNVVSDNFNTIE